MSFVLFAGSRSLPRSAAPLVASAVRAVAGSGRGVAVGCSSGADAFALAAARSAGASLRVFAVGGPLGVALQRPAFGFWSGSALSELRPVAPRVAWWAGGSCGCPSCSAGSPGSCPSLRKRLARRTRAAVDFAAYSGPGAGFVGFLSSHSSAGTLGAARAAAHAGLPIVVFPIGLSSAQLPSFWRGSWTVAGSGLWSHAFRWTPRQPDVDLGHYQGCFVAVSGDRVLGHGATADAARHAAVRNDRKHGGLAEIRFAA